MTGRSSKTYARTVAATTDIGAVHHLGTTFEYAIVRSARRHRTIELSMDASGLRVAAPVRTPLREIEQFVRSRIPWILKQQRTPVARRTPLAFVDGDVLPLEGRMYPLYVTARRARGVAVTLDLFNIRIEVPARYEGDRRREVIARAVGSWYVERAREALEASVARWTPIIGRAPRRMLVRDQRRRWGSYAPDGTLRFNWRLVMLPPELMDYVVVHELTHLEMPHHAPTFWAAVRRVMPDYRARQERIRRAATTFPVLD